MVWREGLPYYQQKMLCSYSNDRGGIHRWSPGRLASLPENPKGCTPDVEYISKCRRNAVGLFLGAIGKDGGRVVGIWCSSFA